MGYIDKLISETITICKENSQYTMTKDDTLSHYVQHMNIHSRRQPYRCTKADLDDRYIAMYTYIHISSIYKMYIYLKMINIRKSIDMYTWYCLKTTPQCSLHVTGIESYSHSTRVLNALGSSFKSYSYT